MSQQDQEIAQLRAEVQALKQDMNELKVDVKELVAAWNAAQTFTSFVKWAASVATAVTILLTAFKWKA